MKKPLTERLDIDLLNDLELAKVNPNLTAAEIARKHGLSRQYVHQIMKKLYPRPYLWYKERKKKAISSKKPPKNWHRIGKNTSLASRKRIDFENLCRSKGFLVEYSPNLQAYHLKINGKKVLIRAANTAIQYAKTAKMRYFKVNIENLRNRYIDVLAYFHKPSETWLLFPIKGHENPKNLYIPEKIEESHSHFQHQENWEIFKDEH
jgi:hypothetical protein